MSNTRNTPVEAIERYLPVRIRQYALRKDSAGGGEYRGGEGIVREYEMLTDTSVTVLSERRRRSPYGAAGGGPGGVGRNTLIRDGQAEALPGKDRAPVARRGSPPRSKPRAAAGYGAPNV